MSGYGSGFALLPLRAAALERGLANWDDGALAVLVAIASHADGEGSAFPSHHRLAALGGVSKSTVQVALADLSKLGLVTIKLGPRGHRYSITLGASEDSVAVRQSVVFSGLWAACTPPARKLFIVLLARSRPGCGDEGRHIPNWDTAVEESRGEDGVRHVLPEHLEPAKLANLIGANDRTYRRAMERVIKLGLVEDNEDNGGLLIPNDPGRIVPAILESLKRPQAAEYSASAKRAATWRKKRRERQLDKSVPLGEGVGDEGGSPLPWD
jgi:Helix-turn-helix domain